MWQVFTSSSVYALMNGVVMVTSDRSGSTKVGIGVEPLGDAEDVVPTAGVETADVVPQLVEDLVHLERGGDGLDEHGRTDRPSVQPESVLGGAHDVVPQPSLVVALQLGQVEVGPRTRGTGSRPLWKTYSPKSNRLAETGSPSTVKCFSGRCQPRGRTTSVAVSSSQACRSWPG